MMSRMIADIDQISDGLLQGFTNLFGGIATILGTIGFMLYVNVKLALIVIVLTPLSLIVATLIAEIYIQVLPGTIIYSWRNEWFCRRNGRKPESRQSVPT